MTEYSIRPSWSVFRYIDDTLHPSDFEHKMVIPCLVADLPVVEGDNPLLSQKGGGTINFFDAADAMSGAIATVFNTHVKFLSFDLWVQVNPTDTPLFINTHVPDSATGVIDPAFTTVAYNETVLTLRTAGGHRKKFYFMEDVNPPNRKERAPFTTFGSFNTFVTYVTGSESWVVGRDGAFLTSPVSISVKTSDALLKHFGV